MEQSSLVRLQEDFDIRVDWRGFELHPETPVGGMSVTDFFRGRPLEKVRERMARFGAEFGVDIVVPEHLSNTRQALAMAEYARDHDALDLFRQAVTRAYWQEGKDLESDEVLAALAQEAGLDAVEALAASRDQVYHARVLANRTRGMEDMVMGVPTLFFGRMPVVGCQRYETYEIVAERAGLVRRG